MPIDIWDPNRGGAERYMLRLALSLLERGHEVTVICLEDTTRGSPVEGLRVEELPVPHFPRWRRELNFARETVRAHERAGRDVLLAVRHALRADVYQPHGGSFRAGRAAAIQAAPALSRFWRRCLDPLRPTVRVLLWLDRQVFLRSPGLVTVSVSRKVEDDFRRVYPRFPFHFERVYNAVDTERFHDRDRGECREILCSEFRIPRSPHGRVAIFAAHTFRLKGLAHALGALSRAADWHLLVVGRDRPGRFQRQADSLAIAGRVRLAGARDDLRRLCAGADALLLPTYYDTCSLAALEALACGTPVITTRQNGAAELIEPARAGFVVDAPGDEAAMARALGELAADWQGFHERALSLRPSLSWSQHADRLEAIIVRAAARSR